LVRFQIRERDFSFIQNEQIGSGSTHTPTEQELEPTGRAAEVIPWDGLRRHYNDLQRDDLILHKISVGTQEGGRTVRRSRHIWENKYYRG